jgi:hypothetical protein
LASGQRFQIRGDGVGVFRFEHTRYFPRSLFASCPDKVSVVATTANPVANTNDIVRIMSLLVRFVPF